MHRRLAPVRAACAALLLAGAAAQAALPAPDTPPVAALRAAAERGDAAAAYALARHYRGLSGTTIDLPQALAYTRQAAERGHVQAQLDLAFVYLDGRDGAARDAALARRWFERAARGGAVRAQCMLGDFHRDGSGGAARDPAAALRWYRASAASDDACAARSQFELYRAYAAGSGVPRDLAAATVWLQRSAEAGNRVAQLALSRAYRDGQGVPRDTELERRWWRKSREGVAPHDDHEHDLPSFAGPPAATLGAAAPATPPAVRTVATGASSTPRTIAWDELLPPGWTAEAGLNGQDLSRLQDGDPRAAQLLQRLRQAWNDAPANPRLQGASVRVPGYVVPLEQTPAGVSEFLLVPHFGACIHTPPPPANQIIHVRLKSPMKTLSAMDSVWLAGTLQVQRADTAHGVSGYSMQALRVEPYSSARR